MDLRELKALELAAWAKIVPADDGTWQVPAQSVAGTYRVVTWPNAESCECEDSQLRAQPCKHILAARLVEEREGKRQAPPIVTDEVPKRPTYKQDWKAYNEAATTEKKRLLALLFDLCRGIKEPEQPWTGRRRVPVADVVMTCGVKVYTQLSCRRFACDLQDAADRGLLTRMINPITVCSFLESEALTPILENLIAQAALPLRSGDSVQRRFDRLLYVTLPALV